MSQEEREQILRAHLDHHYPKAWLLEGCKREEANTIREAVERVSEDSLRRWLARKLSRL